MQMTDAELVLTRYVMFRRDRIGRRRGGVILYVKESIQALTLTYVLMPCVLFVISLVFPALISMPYCVDVFSRRSTKLASSCSSPAKPSMSSAKRRLVTFLPPMMTVPWWFPKASIMIRSRKCWRVLVIVGILVELRVLFETSLLCCCWRLLHWWHFHIGFQWFGQAWSQCCTSSWLPIGPHAIPYQRPFWNLGRHDTGFADVEGISRKAF